MANPIDMKAISKVITSGGGQIEGLGVVSVVPMGEWNATTAYYKLNFVRYNGCLYLAKKTNTNVAPGVNAGWQEVWMPCVYDGGTVALDGTYPDMTAGKVMHALLFGNKSYDGSSEQTITAADLGLADAYKPQGSITFSGLPATPNASNYGFVWNISDNFTTDSRFIEGAGKKYNAGTNVGVIEQNGSYYYDIFGAFVDLSNYALINGTYLNMRVGTATYADGATNDSQGRKIDETYATKDVATQSAAGLMSAADKTKLDNMSSGGGGTLYYTHILTFKDVYYEEPHITMMTIVSKDSFQYDIQDVARILYERGYNSNTCYYPAQGVMYCDTDDNIVVYGIYFSKNNPNGMNIMGYSYNIGDYADFNPSSYSGEYGLDLISDRVLDENFNSVY